MRDARQDRQTATPCFVVWVHTAGIPSHKWGTVSAGVGCISERWNVSTRCVFRSVSSVQTLLSKILLRRLQTPYISSMTRRTPVQEEAVPLQSCTCSNVASEHAPSSGRSKQPSTMCLSARNVSRRCYRAPNLALVRIGDSYLDHMCIVIGACARAPTQ